MTLKPLKIEQFATKDPRPNQVLIDVGHIRMDLDRLASQLQRELADRWHSREDMDEAKGISYTLERINECFGTDYQTHIGKIADHHYRPLKTE